MTTDDVPAEILVLANEFVELYQRTEEWPEDHWIALEGWDLNLWIIEDDFECTLCATLYQVVDGVTDTSDWVTIFEETNG